MWHFLITVASTSFAGAMVFVLHLVGATLPEKIIGGVMVYMLTTIHYNQPTENEQK